MLCYNGNTDDSKFAIFADETGYDITDYEQSLEDPKLYKISRQGRRTGFWDGYDESVTINIGGEVNGDLDSIPPVQLACTGAITVANIFDMDTVATGGVYHDTSTITQARGPVLATFTTSATRIPGLS